MLELPSLSLYIHVPWCIRKCPYCDFNSHEASGALPETEYIDALCTDFDQDLPMVQSRPIDSVFIGGGTPSLLSPQAYERLFNHIAGRASFADNCEITLEANPGTAEAAKFKGYRKAGINRLSLGIQSFNDTHLKSLGRVHDSQEASKAIAIAIEAGFDNYNLDLMFGLPQQSLRQAMLDLEQALGFQPTHLSWYQLTIEPNTVFYNHPPSVPPEDHIIEMHEAGRQLLSHAGFDRYEVSAYSLPGRRSIHNMNYWQFGDYIGIGAGAHGKVTHADTSSIWRTRKSRQPSHYLINSVGRTAEKRLLSKDELPVEFMLNALRLRHGFDQKLFASRTGLPFSVVEKQVEYLLSRQLLARHAEILQPTDTGYELLNSVLEEFV